MISRTTDMAGEEKKPDNMHTSVEEDLTTLTSDFQCPICGAIFTTDEDRKQHMEKEAHGELHEGTTQKEMKIAEEQEELNESHYHHI
jgi:uncharacterized C2H2 Zn-finger protein